MRQVRDVIRLKWAGMLIREIARRMGTAPSTVRLTMRRFEAAGLTWPLSDDLTDAVLETQLFAGQQYPAEGSIIRRSAFSLLKRRRRTADRGF